jgi:NADPH2:quinone reductase
VIDAVGGEVLSEALGALALDGSLTTLGYSAGRKATIDVTNLIWRQAGIKSFSLHGQPQAAWVDAWNAIVPLLQSGAIKPIVAKTFPLTEAADALRYLVEGRPFGRGRPHNLTSLDERRHWVLRPPSQSICGHRRFRSYCVLNAVRVS